MAFSREQLQVEVSAHLSQHLVRDDVSGWAVVGSTVAVYLGGLALATLGLSGLRQEPLLGGAALVLGVAIVALSQVRAFLVHHDLCHGALFRTAGLRRALAPVVGALASTSPSVWSREHNRHHKDSNKLDRPQDGQTASWTVEQYLQAPAWQRWAYYLLNQRPLLFLVIPPLYFLGFMRVRARLHENLVFALFMTGLWATHTISVFFWALLPATWFGFLLFHAQHTFEGVYRRRSEQWDFFDNGMLGSSVLVLPDRRLLRWFLYGVGCHALHHLSPAVPGYQLERCLAERPELYTAAPRVRIADALAATQYTLYDEAAGRLVSFAGLEPWTRRSAG